VTLAYFDTNAFVKLLVQEPGSDVAAAVWTGADAVATSPLASPELRGALAAGRRRGDLSAQALSRAVLEWSGLWTSLRVVPLSEAVTARSGELAEDHVLTGADAVHLASALALSQEVLFVTWDQRLARAARAEGLTVVPAL